ncbi:MAG: ATP-grasp domain-containing protein [Nanoarchaeota archaeon]|nr:ATP-grasp domain-containing protein [Nanoarchaeota archaeon]
MKTVGFLVETKFYEKSRKDILNKFIEQLYGFITFSKLNPKKDFKIVIGCVEDYKDKCFTFCYSYENRKLIKIYNQKLDFVFDRSLLNKDTLKIKERIQNELPMLNNLFLSKLCWDKYATYKKFRKLMPKTYLVNNKDEAMKVIDNIKSDKIVIKPRDGLAGKGVIVINKKNLLKNINIHGDTLVQEFVDSSNGIKELGIKGVHDLRIVTLSAKIDHAYVRKPKKGLVSNIARGGSVTHVNLSRIPSTALSIIKKVDKEMSKFGPRFYTVDMAFNNRNKPILIELESIPVLRSAYKNLKVKSIQKRFISNIIDNIAKLK